MAGITLNSARTGQHRVAAGLLEEPRRSERPSRRGDRISWLWNRVSIRWQILSTFILINLLAGIAAAIVIVYNAQRAAQVEITASMDLAERLVREVVERPHPGSSPATLLDDLALQISGLRHVRILVTDAQESRTSLLPADIVAETASDGVRVPGWFSKLIHVSDGRREMRIVLNGHQIGAVVLVGRASDEIAEVWQDTVDLAVVAAVLDVTVLAVLYLALGRVLSPLTDLAKGLGELERGQFRYRLAPPKARQLLDIANRFNALADRLGAAKADNNRLTRRLITVPDEERRHIATELHDEIGPCIFGIKANIASLDQLASGLPAVVGSEMRERIAALGEIADKIQALNRRLLNRIRPMALGHVPLADVLSGLVAEFERLNPHPRFSITMGSLATGYGDSIDLTIYRCVQEGVTNAVRHAEPKIVSIELEERTGDGSADSPALLLSIRDDGRGMAPGMQPGFGLTTMEERVRALGGTLTISSRSGTGTRLDIAIPLDDVQRQGRVSGGQL